MGIVDKFMLFLVAFSISIVSVCCGEPSAAGFRSAADRGRRSPLPDPQPQPGPQPDAGNEAVLKELGVEIDTKPGKPISPNATVKRETNFKDCLLASRPLFSHDRAISPNVSVMGSR